jgi:hypothetical protein
MKHCQLRDSSPSCEERLTLIGVTLWRSGERETSSEWHAAANLTRLTYSTDTRLSALISFTRIKVH